MRASYQRVRLLDSMWRDFNAPQAAVVAGSSLASVGKPAPPGLGLQHRASMISRMSSSAMHPQDDHCLLFQLLSGAVGLVDLNPS